MTADARGAGLATLWSQRPLVAFTGQNACQRRRSNIHGIAARTAAATIIVCPSCGMRR